ncbi:MAG: hypothetical protein AB1750_14350 [Chloroflexota bacterium]
MAVCLLAILLGPGLLQKKVLPALNEYFATPTPSATPTPTITPTPHVYLTPPADIFMVQENFDSNRLKWRNFFSDNTVRVEGGKLRLKSDKNGYIGTAYCSGCPDFGKTLYYQAELVPAAKTTIRHGISFCLSRISSKYYVFMIDSVNSTYQLYRHVNDEWQDLTSNVFSTSINKYPASNTLGVFFDQGRMKLYINEALVEIYADPEPLQCKWVGMIVDNSGVDLIADNVFAYKARGVLVPTATP